MNLYEPVEVFQSGVSHWVVRITAGDQSQRLVPGTYANSEEAQKAADRLSREDPVNA
jgi:hypothetical protein